MLTKKQKNVLNFIKKYKIRKEYAPSLDEIRKHFRLASVSTAHYYVSRLHDLKYLSKKNKKPRAIFVPVKERLVNIPLLGLIAAGQPLEAIQNRDTIAVAQSKLPSSGEFFALRVVGNSMIDENINDGDIVLVKKQNTAHNGQKVVALIDNYEATLKTYYKDRGSVKLIPANKNIAPIIVKKDRNISIQGVVIDVLDNNEKLRAADIATAENITRNAKLPLDKIISGDAVQELRKLPGNSCDIIIIDPPYNIGKDFGNNIDKRELCEYVSWGKSWINEAIRIIKPTGTIYVYGFSEILAHLSVEMPINKRWLIWHYTNKNVASLHFWQRSHEAIICAWKGKPLFNRDEVREPYTEGFLNGAAGKTRKGTLGRFSRAGKETVYNAHENGALPRDVIKIPALAGGAGMIERWFLCKTCDNVFQPRKLREHLNHEIIKHPTQKPLELTKRLIKSAMPHKDGIVLMPFAGSGSECVVSKELGLSYIGFEINPDYIRIAAKWLDNTKRIPELF
ncbi:MAG: transcriptional repressor LexA [Kiritimatiellae bacterium]|jgi:site-specific DNA-methyltransferase (adenine-specific)|nr:transcriptional repressor LexA [Kiritimatiellia bacterium]